MGSQADLSMSSAKQETYRQFAAVARVLGSGNRLELLELVAQGERSVERLAEISGLTVANTSQHLQQMRRVGLVQSRPSGKHVLYRIGDGPILELVSALQRVAEHAVSEVQALVVGYFDQRDDLQPITRDDLVDRLQRSAVTLIDVRPEDEFRHGHVPGAIHLPLEELEARLADLPREGEIIAYCRGRYCVLAFEAVAALRARGFSVRRLEGGFPEWKAAGLGIESAAA